MGKKRRHRSEGAVVGNKVCEGSNFSKRKRKGSERVAADIENLRRDKSETS